MNHRQYVWLDFFCYHRFLRTKKTKQDRAFTGSRIKLPCQNCILVIGSYLNQFKVCGNCLRYNRLLFALEVMSSLLVIKCFITKRLLITFRIAFVLIIAQSIEIITRKCILFTHVLKKIFKQLIMFYILFQVRQF